MRRFYYFPFQDEAEGKMEDGKWIHRCLCGWSGVEVNASVNDDETWIKHLCPQCGREVGGLRIFDENGR